jgi:hypothetical protein
VLERVYGVDRAVEPQRDLARRQPRNQAQEHDLALVLGQRRERGAQVGKPLARRQLGGLPGSVDLGQGARKLRAQVVEGSG